jgi:predicted CopG family antitoxin
MTEKTFDEVIEETVEDRFEKEVEILEKSVELSSDEEVMELARLRIPEPQSQRISELLRENAELTISEAERNELIELMNANRLYDLRKGIGIAEAVRRGLIATADDLR